LKINSGQQVRGGMKEWAKEFGVQPSGCLPAAKQAQACTPTSLLAGFNSQRSSLLGYGQPSLWDDDGQSRLPRKNEKISTCASRSPG
jgi:hypothetical protein